MQALTQNSRTRLTRPACPAEDMSSVRQHHAQQQQQPHRPALPPPQHSISARAVRGLAHSYTARRLLAASKLTLSHTGERVLLSVAAVGLCLCNDCCLHLANTALSRQLRLLGQLGADGAGYLGSPIVAPNDTEIDDLE